MPLIKLNIPEIKPINIARFIKYMPIKKKGISFKEYIFLENLKKSNSMIKFNNIIGRMYIKLILVKKNITKNNNVINVKSTDKN